MFHINTQIPRHGSTGAYIPGPRPHSTTPALSLSPLPPPSLHPCARRPSPLLRTSFLLAIAPPGPIFGALYLSLSRAPSSSPTSSPSAPLASSLARTVARAAPPNTFVVASLLARLLALIQGPRFSLHLSSSSSSSSYASSPHPAPFPLRLLLFSSLAPAHNHAQFCASCNILFTSLLILWIPRRVRLRATILPLLLLVSNRMGKTRNSIPDLVSRSLFAPEEANNERRRDLIIDRSEFASSF